MTNETNYPLGDRPEEVETPGGTPLSDITLEEIVEGNVSGDELKIAAETLEKQAQVAEDAGRPQTAQNFRRAAELTAVPDERILEMYNALRPSGAQKDQLQEIADELEEEYGAETNAALVRETIEVYEERELF